MAGSPACGTAVPCSLGTRLGEEQPIGTAAMHAQHVFVEVPMPWADAVSDSRHFPKALNAVRERTLLAGRSFRVVAVAPDPAYSRDGHARVLSFRRPAGAFSTFLKDDFLVPQRQVASLVEALIDRGAALERFAPYRALTDDVRDLFICTHGSHDACCGSLGFPLYEHARRVLAAELSGRLRVWRTSHFGGHRFAPTVIDFPEGRAWAHADPDLLSRILHHDLSPALIARHYRGWSGAASPYEQTAEREALMLAGGSWTSRCIATQTLAIDERLGIADVRVEFTDPRTQVAGAYDVTVEVAGQVRTGSCQSGDTVSLVKQYRAGRIIEVASAHDPVLV
jgi:hypothetical protein